MNKKGISTPVINWVFVMIAGAVILIFVFKIINSQGEITELQVSAELLEDMGNVLVGRSVSENSFTEIDIPSDKIFLFKCEGFCNPNTGCDSYVKDLAGDKQIETKVRPIFSAERIKFTPKIYSFVESWKIPFNVVNFVYLAYPGQKFVLPGTCTGLCSRIYNKIPNKLKTGKIITDSSDTGISRAKFVKNIYFETSCAGFTPPENQKSICVDAYEIHFWKKGTINIEKDLLDALDPNSNKYYYLTDEEILGAIFTENAQTYECNMRKAEYKYKKAIKVYQTKVRPYLTTAYVYNTNCLSRYNDFVGMGGYKQDPPDFFNELNRLKTDSLVENTENTNRYLMRNDCSPIY